MTRAARSIPPPPERARSTAVRRGCSRHDNDPGSRPPRFQKEDPVRQLTCPSSCGLHTGTPRPRGNDRDSRCGRSLRSGNGCRYLPLAPPAFPRKGRRTRCREKPFCPRFPFSESRKTRPPRASRHHRRGRILPAPAPSPRGPPSPSLPPPRPCAQRDSSDRSAGRIGN